MSGNGGPWRSGGPVSVARSELPGPFEDADPEPVPLAFSDHRCPSCGRERRRLPYHPHPWCPWCDEPPERVA